MHSAGRCIDTRSLQQLRRSDNLASVPLRVIGEMYEEASDARGKLLLTDSARLFEIGHSESTNAPNSVV